MGPADKEPQRAQTENTATSVELQASLAWQLNHAWLE